MTNVCSITVVSPVWRRHQSMYILRVYWARTVLYHDVSVPRAIFGHTFFAWTLTIFSDEFLCRQFLWNRSQPVIVDCCRSKLVKVVSGVQQGSASDPLLFLLYPYFFQFWKIRWSVMPMTPLLCHAQTGVRAISCRVHDPWPLQGSWVVWPLGNQIECA